MVVLKSIAWILAILLALLTGLSLLPIDLLLRSDGAEGFRLGVRILGFALGGSKKKAPKKKKKTENPLIKAIKKSLGLPDTEEMRTASGDDGFSAALTDTAESLLQLLDRALWLLKRCRVPYCRITAVTAGENAALDYGVACATLYPLTGYLRERMGLHPKRLKMELRCDYALEEGRFELDLAVRVRLIHVLRALLHILTKNVEKTLKEVS